MCDFFMETCTFKILPQYIFRRSNPFIAGVKIISGTLEKNMKVFSNGNYIGKIFAITNNNISVNKAEVGEEVAISIPSGILGRNIIETDLFSSVSNDEPSTHLFIKQHTAGL